MNDLSNNNKEILRSLQEMAAKGELFGRFADIPIEVYHHPACPGISSTTIKSVVKKSPAHIKNEKPLVFGSAFHAFVNEPDIFNKTYLNGGFGCLGVEDFQLIKVMSEKLHKHPDVKEFYQGVVHEMTFFAKDPVSGLLLKCRVDNYIEESRKIADLKTCADASESAFQYDAKKFFYRVSAAHYLKVVSLVMGIPHRDFYLIACEKMAPNEVAVYRVNERSISLGEMECAEALKRLANPNGHQGYFGIKELSI